MTERDTGYLHALAGVQNEVRMMVHDSSTTSEGKLELLGVLSLLSELVDAKIRSNRGHVATATSIEDPRRTA
jgi:hypothetical protein